MNTTDELITFAEMAVLMRTTDTKLRQLRNKDPATFPKAVRRTASNIMLYKKSHFLKWQTGEQFIGIDHKLASAFLRRLPNAKVVL